MINVKNISKIYKLYTNPKDRLKEALHPFRKKYHTDFYALKNVSFNIKLGLSEKMERENPRYSKF